MGNTLSRIKSLAPFWCNINIFMMTLTMHVWEITHSEIINLIVSELHTIKALSNNVDITITITEVVKIDLIVSWIGMF